MAVSKVRWGGQSVLITGGGGFIGSLLATELARLGAMVSIIDIQRRNLDLWQLKGPSFHRVDVRNEVAVQKVVGRLRPAWVFHLAAESQVLNAYAKPSPSLNTNVRGTWNVLEACRRHDIPFLVYASSDKAYGVHGDLPYTENHPLRASFVYDTTKSCGDFLAQAYANTYGLRVSISRCGNVYGPGDLNWNRIVPHVLRAVISGKNPVLRSDGRSRRDFVFVDDAVDAYIRLGKATAERQLKGEPYNFGTGQPLEVLKLVSALLSELGCSGVRLGQSIGPAKEIAHQFLSYEKAHRDLGWRPRTSLREGIARTVAWYRQYLSPAAPKLSGPPVSRRA